MITGNQLRIVSIALFIGFMLAVAFASDGDVDWKKWSLDHQTPIHSHWEFGWMKIELAKEWKEGWTEDQFIYKTRKKGFGPFKRELLDLPEENLGPIREKLEQTFDFLFHKLNVTKTKELIAQHLSIRKVGKPRPACLQ